MFRLFADNSQCKHIFFAGCHDTGYLSLLTPYIAKRNRITLLKAASFHPEFKTLDLPIREMPEVFMSAPLYERQPTASAPSPTAAFASASRAQVCKHFQKVFWAIVIPPKKQQRANDFNTGHLQIRQ
jgi:hypothetical protein